MLNTKSIEQYYKEHYPYLHERFEYNHWYCDTSELLYIHPNGIPVYFNLKKLCKFRKNDTYKNIFKNPVLTEKQFLHMVYEVISYTTNCDIKDNNNKYASIAKKSFKQVKNNLAEMYHAKMESTKEIFHSIGYTLGLECEHLTELKEWKSVYTTYSNSYGYFDMKDKTLILKLYLSPQPSGDYYINMEPNVDNFHHWILHMLNKCWVTRNHINLMFSAYAYIIGKPRINLFSEFI